MRILIGEDEVLTAKCLKCVVESFGYEVVGIGHNKENVIRMIDKYIPDMLLQDINMDESSDGIDVGRYVLENYSFPHIYVTAHSDIHIVKKALETKPVGYIIKPFVPIMVYTAIQIAMDHYKDHHEQEILTIKDGYNMVKLPYYSIQYLKADNVYVEIHTSKKVYIVRDTLEQFHQKLDQNLFFRTHRSYLVNRHHVENMGPNFLSMKGATIPLSRKYQASIRSLF